MTIATINPATGATVRTFTPLGDDEIDARLERAAATARSFPRDTHFADRGALMLAAAGLLTLERDDVARTMTLEMGKTLASALAEVDKCASAMRWYAAHAAHLLADERPTPSDIADTGAADAYVRYRPLGAVLAVMPWNFPMWQVIRFAAPALMAGNTGLLKHASNVPQTALYLGELFTRAGFPEGAFQTLLIGSGAVEKVLRDPRVAAATLTGSEPAGRVVAAVAGDEIKPTVLELGGSDPFVVMPSADVPAAARTAVTARVQNNGQSCIAAKRFIVHTDVFEEFAELFTEGMRALRVGDPFDDAVDVGPLATAPGRDDIARQVEDAVSLGADVLCGGGRPQHLAAPFDGGWFFEPTVIAGITPQMRVHHEETFGPVATLHRATGLDDALAIADATPFGLSANLWTRDESDIDRFVRDVHAGGVFVNGMTKSHPALPFGGVKRSGYGRELAAHGIRAFCNVTTVWRAPGH